MVGKKNWKDFFLKELVWSRFWNLATLGNFHWIRRRWYQFDEIKQTKQSFFAEVIGGISTKSLMSRCIHNNCNRSSTTGNLGLLTRSHFWFKYPNTIKEVSTTFLFRISSTSTRKTKNKNKTRLTFTEKQKPNEMCGETVIYRRVYFKFKAMGTSTIHKYDNFLSSGEELRVMFLATKHQ